MAPKFQPQTRRHSISGTRALRTTGAKWQGQSLNLSTSALACPLEGRSHWGTGHMEDEPTAVSITVAQETRARGGGVSATLRADASQVRQVEPDLVR